MSATTGIPSRSLWGHDTSLPWSERAARPRDTLVVKESTDHGPPRWLANLGQLLLTVLFTLASLPLIVIGAIVAAVVAAWALLLPALAAGFVIAIASFIVAAL